MDRRPTGQCRQGRLGLEGVRLRSSRPFVRVVPATPGRSFAWVCRRSGSRSRPRFPGSISPRAMPIGSKIPLMVSLSISSASSISRSTRRPPGDTRTWRTLKNCRSIRTETGAPHCLQAPLVGDKRATQLSGGSRRTTRKPRPTLRKVGAMLWRLAERHSRGWRTQEPPRRTRCPPVVGPWGSMPALCW